MLLDLPIGAEVRCADGYRGRSTHLVLDPNARHVSHLVIKERGFWGTERLVPVALVADGVPVLIRLRCTRYDLARLETFVDAEIRWVGEEEPPESRRYLRAHPQPDLGLLVLEYERTPPGELAVSARTHVEAHDGSAGRLAGLVVEPTTGRITHLMLWKGHLWRRKLVVVPVLQVERFGETVVHLRVDRHALDLLPSDALEECPS